MKQPLEVLIDLRCEISTLANSGRLTEKFVDWHLRFSEAIVDFFGEDSEEMFQFRSIHVEVPPELYDMLQEASERVLPKKLKEQVNIGLMGKLSESYFKKRSYEFKELINSMIISIKKSKPT